jgi:acyl-CoA synthetase (AMP-forming)/AMP-acid ligase II
MIVAWASTKPGMSVTVEELEAHCREKELAPFQMPESFEITDMPLPTSGGKLAKKLLREPSYVRMRLGQSLVSILEDHKVSSTIYRLYLQVSCTVYR